MQCLVKITNEFYDNIQPHLDQLYAASLNAIENDEKEIILQGIEFWISICKIELERKKFSETEKPVRGYIDQCYPWLVKVIQENITRIEENDYLCGLWYLYQSNFVLYWPFIRFFVNSQLIYMHNTHTYILNSIHNKYGGIILPNL